MSQAIKWAAELRGVKETSVLGRADLSFWEDYLRPADLLPAQRDGNAQVLIVAGAGKFAGIRFRELSFSVLVSQAGPRTWRDAAYLVQAINSCRVFAFCERVFFSTPYDFGDVRVAGTFPAAIEFAQKGGGLFKIRMQGAASAPGRELASCGEDGWEGAVFLPERRNQSRSARKMFFARIQGYSRKYFFIPGTDSIRIEPSPEFPVLQALVDSNFVPVEWVLRDDAVHAKSKTYLRSETPEPPS